jgi:hypothetical protein
MSLPLRYYLSFFPRTLTFIAGAPEQKEKPNLGRFRLAFKLNKGDVLSYTCTDCLLVCAKARIGEFTSPVFVEDEKNTVPDAVRRWMENHTRLHSEMRNWAETRMRGAA